MHRLTATFFVPFLKWSPHGALLEYALDLNPNTALPLGLGGKVKEEGPAICREYASDLDIQKEDMIEWPMESPPSILVNSSEFTGSGAFDSYGALQCVS